VKSVRRSWLGNSTHIERSFPSGSNAIMHTFNTAFDIEIDHETANKILERVRVIAVGNRAKRRGGVTRKT